MKKFRLKAFISSPAFTYILQAAAIFLPYTFFWLIGTPLDNPGDSSEVKALKRLAFSTPVTLALAIIAFTAQINASNKRLEENAAIVKDLTEQNLAFQRFITSFVDARHDLWPTVFRPMKANWLAQYVFQMIREGAERVKALSEETREYGVITGITVVEEPTLVRADVLLWKIVTPIVERVAGSYCDVFATHFSDPKLWTKEYVDRLAAQKEFLGSKNCVTSVHRFFCQTREGGFKQEDYDEAIVHMEKQQNVETKRFLKGYDVRQGVISSDLYLDFIWIPALKIAIIWKTDREKVTISPEKSPIFYELVHLEEKSRLENRIKQVLTTAYRGIEWLELEVQNGKKEDLALALKRSSVAL